jgi:putative thioredoxin
MIDVSIQNFEAEVIAASMSTPVLVDFWAPWCGPCKTLGPILEKLETAYEGRFRLVKIDSDKEQQLAQAFGVRSIPTCVLMMNGQPVDGFMGALPEGKVREFLDRHVPTAEEMEAEAETEEAEALLQQGDAGAALSKLQEALALNPANDDARYDYARLLIGAGQLEQAEAALAPTRVQVPVQLRFEALTQWLEAIRFADSDPRGAWSPQQFDERIARDKRDFDTRFARSRLLMAQGEWTAAMDELLEIIMRDKAWSEGAARKTYIAILELLTPPKPKAGPEAGGKSAGGIELSGKSAMLQDPQAELVSRYRRKLSMMLN